MKTKKDKTFILLAVFLCYVFNTQAQTDRKIMGKVVDTTGGLAGVSVVIKGTTNGTTTDFNGVFHIIRLHTGC